MFNLKRILLGLSFVLAILICPILASADSGGTWEQKSDVPNPGGLYKTSSATVAGKIYTFGGQSYPESSVDLNAVNMYDPSTNSWSVKATITKSNETTATQLNDKIYFQYGALGNGNFNKYDPATNSVVLKATPPG
ncbi:kelch repeat-containing protein [Paenibacillus qinlingensis]|uniref:kelch repeat-containing protein n=1 Tax=Paenibacillus qinlingensis TaxID=1837343 RepID=UPI00156720C2|nr:kelch repeat-containing protein [Paenibacillus qinlingensis]